IAANKIDAIIKTEPEAIDLDENGDLVYAEAQADPIELIRNEFEPKGVKVFPISGVTGEGIKDLLYYVRAMLNEVNLEPIVFEAEYVPEEAMPISNEPYTVIYDEKEDEYVVEGPRIEKMLGYTNLESEKGFRFFQNFMKDNGILEELEKLGIQECDTVRMYGLSFDYYK
ncbi:MAG: Obg family GTPase CgtA, partial [Lachnospiraceae bacterium]|nr:Obg family GTPase CgtA [Lachnospiraceae bacterium]